MSIGDVNVDKYTQLRQQIKLDCLQNSKEDGKHSQRKRSTGGIVVYYSSIYSWILLGLFCMTQK